MLVLELISLGHLVIKLALISMEVYSRTKPKYIKHQLVQLPEIREYLIRLLVLGIKQIKCSNFSNLI
jgi:hypothetical protein